MNRIYSLGGAVEMMRDMKRSSFEAAGTKWQRIINKQRGSGLSVSGFCRREGVAVSTFFFWKRRLAAEGRDEAPSFVEVTVARQVDSNGPEVPLELLLGFNRRLVIRRGFDAAALREVVRALEDLG